MPAPIVNSSWLNQNSLRNYPLSEEATLKDISGGFKLPEDFIVDLIFPVHSTAELEVSKFHIGRVSIFGTGVTVTLAHDGVFIGSVSIDAGAFTRNQTFFISGSGDFFDSVGKIVIGTLATILKSAGSFTFDLAGGRLEPAVVAPDIRGVTGLRTQNGNDLSALAQGDVILKAGRNILFEAVPGAGPVPDILVVNAIDGEGLNVPCECDDLPEGDPIRTINLIPPDDAGNFELVEDECIKITEIENGLQLEDECSKPCCGCSELNVIEQDIQRMNDQVLSLQSFAQRLDAVVQGMQAVILASRIGQTNA